ncbi:MAG: AAA family ATPase, partial [Pseudobdellovibrionaceae bacterium]|nr:AAA family ATPase [Pseudobdellovibrionaceae bacterium]
MTGLLRPGQMLHSGQIEVIDFVGGGGVGEVYRAFWHQNGERKIVAVKCFDPAKMEHTNLEAIELVHRESLAMSRVHHAHAAQILISELETSLPFIVEEYLPEGNLDELIQGRHSQKAEGEALFTAYEIANMGQQACSALTMLHQENLYHGDLKPSNICFRDRKSLDLAIVDFGHAGFLEGNILERNENLATLAYLPPERTGFVKLAGNASSDLYALGITLYEATHGASPFKGVNTRELVHRLLHEVPQSLHELHPDFPIALSDIISKLLRKNPTERYHSAFGLLVDLERCLRELKAGAELRPFALGTKDKLRELNYRIPVVGREAEIKHLQTRFQKVLEHQSSVTFIGAPSGMGKSRLAFEILQTARQHKAYISHVKFSEYERNLPLSAVSILLVEHSHYLRSLSPYELSLWQKRIADALGSRGQLIANRFSCYRDLLPKFRSDEQKDKDSDFQVFNSALGQFLSLLSARGEPQLLLVDDLQWADWQSLQALSELAKLALSEKVSDVMLLGTYRSNEVTGEHPFTTSVLKISPPEVILELRPLSQAETNCLVQYLLDETSSEVDKLQEVAYKFTGGNPFFVYEYLKSVIHSGVFELNEVDKSWRFHAERIHETNLSAGVAGLVAGRIATLQPLTQHLIAIASLAGHAMGRSALEELLPIMLNVRSTEDLLGKGTTIAAQIELAYQELFQKHLLLPDTEQFVFYHDKVQEAAYLGLTPGDKTLLHEAYGLWLARSLSADQRDSSDKVLFDAAFHLCRAGNHRLSHEARRVLTDAAKGACRVYAFDKARNYLQTASFAVDSAPDASVEEKVGIMQELANTLAMSDQIAEAIKIYDLLLTLVSDPIKRALICSKLVEYNLALFDYKRASEAATLGLDVVGVRTIRTEWIGYIFILAMMAFLIPYGLAYRFLFSRSTELSDSYEEIKLQLQLKNTMALFFLKP